MTTYEFYAILISILTLAVAVVGLIGLRYYVKHTKRIAEATYLQAEATYLQAETLTKPAVTVEIISFKPESFRGTGFRPYEHVGILVENHTVVHANIKINLKYRLRTGSSEKYEQFTATGNYGGDVWNLAAKAKFYGHLTLHGLSGKEILPSDDLIVDIIVESSPFNRNEYCTNPPIQYRWKRVTGEWVPYPVPV